MLDDPETFKTKEVSKLGVLEHILQPDLYPTLYGDIVPQGPHRLLPARAATPRRAGTTSISSDGSGYPMQIKINFLCRDSILAAPVVLDLALFLDLAQRAGLTGDAGVAQLLLQEPDDGRPASTRSTISSSSS